MSCSKTRSNEDISILKYFIVDIRQAPLKSKDEAALLDLTDPERRILRQTFGLPKDDNE